MAETVQYTDGMELELWVQDTGQLDTYFIYVNGFQVKASQSQALHTYPIDKPQRPPLAITIRFAGNDGGLSALFDVAGGQRRELARQSGTAHEWIVS